MRRQAVHEERIGPGCSHHLGVDAPVGEGDLALGVLGFVAHAGPDVGGHHVGVATGVERVLEHLQAIVAAQAHRHRVDLVAVRRAHVQGEAQDVGGLQPGRRHVVAVADPGDDLAFHAAALLDAGEHVGQDLARVVFVGEAVDHRHPRVRGEALDDRLLEGTDHHDVDHSRDHARDVLDRLPARELRVAAIEVDRDAAQLIHARFE